MSAWDAEQTVADTVVMDDSTNLGLLATHYLRRSIQTNRLNTRHDVDLAARTRHLGHPTRQFLETAGCSHIGRFNPSLTAANHA